MICLAESSIVDNIRSADIRRRSRFLSGRGKSGTGVELELEFDPERGGKAGGCGDTPLRGGSGGFSAYAGGAGLGLRLREAGDGMVPGVNVDALLELRSSLLFPFPLPTARFIILSSNRTVLPLT
jgi:hypothetical protein